MLLSKEVEVRWNNYTRKWYEEKGYICTKINDYFTCKIEDVMKTSTVKVKVKCDYCGEEFEKKYINYINEREIIHKDCCSNRRCMVAKSEEVCLKVYGVSNIAKTKEQKEIISKAQKTSFGDILELCNNKGLTLLSKEEDYKNDRSKLIVICNKHPEYGEQDTNFANIKKNKSCCWYGGNDLIGEKSRNDGQIVYEEFIKVGLTPQFKPEDYKNNSIPMPYICETHKDKGIQYRSYGNLSYNQGCFYCAKERTAEALRNDEEMVFKELINRGLIPLDGEKYATKDEPIRYTCVHHPNVVQTIRFGVLHRTQCPCDYCRMENSLSTLNIYFRSILERWKEASKLNCNYKCVLTGSSNYQVHHLYSYNNIIKDSLNELGLEIKDDISFYTELELFNLKNKILERHENLLGVCIHENLHILFHQLYKKTDNTPEQFEEFKIRYRIGEFNEILVA